MNDWFRSWHGAPTDPKWLLIASKATASLASHRVTNGHTEPIKVTPGMVSAVTWALLDHASQHQERGTVSDFDAETYASFSGFDEAAIDAVIRAMTAKGMIIEGKLANWEKRQPKREDSSAKRTQEWRERKRSTPPRRDDERDADPPPLSPRDAPVTQCDAPEKKREEKKREEEKDSRSVAHATRPSDSLWERFKAAYPKRGGSNPWQPARKKFDAFAKSGVDPEVIISGALLYRMAMEARGQIGTPYVCQAQTWLNQRRWQDQEEPTRIFDFNGREISNGFVQAPSGANANGRPSIRDICNAAADAYDGRATDPLGSPAQRPPEHQRGSPSDWGDVIDVSQCEATGSWGLRGEDEGRAAKVPA